MKNHKHILYYLVALVVFSLSLYLLINNGKDLEQSKVIHKSINEGLSIYDQISELVKHNITHPLAILLLQIVTIIFFARTFGFIFGKIGLPSVIGEIFAGLFLGPSFMGSWLPEFNAYLFPMQSLGNLQFLSQVGLVLFMFVIGMELDLKVLKNKANDALIISHTGIFFSFLLGIGLSYSIYDSFAPPNVGFISFALFMGTAMSITAFPVLARIIHERNLTKTKLGSLTITSAAIDDLTAWCILATVIAIVNAGSIAASMFTISLAVIYVFVMIKFVQPFLKKMGEIYSHKEVLSLNVVGAVFGILLISAFLAEIIGIHALFGAFLAGVIMPPSANFRKILIEKTESVSLGLLLPLFFVFTGLRTKISLLNEGHLWQTAFYIISLAVAGKFIGATVAAKFVGQSWRNSLSMGALMNTRGLMELVVLNIGYDLGILSPEIFAMMVIMALVTTLMTGPLLDLINFAFKKDKEETNEVKKKNFRILLSFASPAGGRKLLRLVNIITGYTKSTTEITALHVTPNTDINQYQLDEYEKESFKLIKAESNKIGLPIKTSYKVNNNVNDEILNDANSGNFDLLIVGAGQSLFEGTLLGKVIGITASALQPERLIGSLIGKSSVFKGNKLLDDKTSQFIKNSKIPVGVFFDHKLETIESVLIVISSVSDVFLFFYAKKIIRNSPANITILDHKGLIESNFDLKEEVNGLEHLSSNTVQLISKSAWGDNLLNDYQLLLASVDSYDDFSESVTIDNPKNLSLLLIRP
ncbi:MAG: cation:proton antiporter [Bacteroidota bacterium]|nr:cation:proton antiporter [Bacteroidota bacterium]